MGDVRRNLERFMAEAGLSADELSKKSGVSNAYISLIRSGARKKIGLPTLSKLSRALGISVDTLITGVRDDSPDRVTISDDELRKFFDNDWERLSVVDKAWIKGAIRIARDNFNKQNGVG